MILYHPDLTTELSLYGIDLPLRDDRSERVFELLKKEFPNLKEFSLKKIPLVGREDLERVHDSSFLDRFYDDGGGFLAETLLTYDCKNLNEDKRVKPLKCLRESHLRQVSATYAALQFSLTSKDKFCFYLGGGMHHARYSFGSGFCPLNDIVVATKKAQKENSYKRALIIDIDAHHGDGTSELTKDDPLIDTFSIHMASSWPFNTELQITPSTLDIGIEKGDEKSYLERLSQGLKFFDKKEYDFVIVVAGADPYEGDELPSTQSLNLSKHQMLARDLIVYKWCQEKGLAQTWVMAGGYGKDSPLIYGQFILKVLHLMG